MTAGDEPDISIVKHRIRLSGGFTLGLGWIFFLGVIFMMSFDNEIRCSMGNKIECAKMEVKAK